MYNKKPPFAITNSILNKIAQIGELVGQVNAVAGLTTNPMLRRTNRIRTIYSSLAIEQNTLSLEQVTAVLSGKRVIAPPKDIAEVKNAYEIYEMMDSLNPYSVDDLLNAHAVLTRGLTEESGCFRSGPVGVVDKQGNILHFGTLPDYAPGLTMERGVSISAMAAGTTRAKMRIKATKGRNATMIWALLLACRDGLSIRRSAITITGI